MPDTDSADDGILRLSDREWDCDITKVLGFGIIVAGLIGFFLEKNDFQWVVAFGSGLIATGKFSKEG